MHILIFLDQNPASLGGVQASVLLQRKYLQLRGHRVSIAAPRSKFKPSDELILYPSFPLTPDREYNAAARLNRAYEYILAELSKVPEPVDVVHVQADWWGALLGAGFAKRQNLPLVHTLHTNLMIGATHVVGALGARLLVFAHSLYFKAWVSPRPNGDMGSAWFYLSQIASRASTVIAPTGHFARLAREMGVAAKLEVLPTGVDDAALGGLFKSSADRSPDSPVRFVWSGRFSNEKRLLEFIDALALSEVPAIVDIYGNGPLEKKAQQAIEQHRLSERVKIQGRISHQQMLQELASADALIQTSVGFETQGMTVYEAGVVGTPSVVCDWNIAEDLPEGSCWQVANQGVPALAETLRTAYSEILAGNAKSVDLRGQLYQSVLSERAEAIYRRVTEK